MAKKKKKWTAAAILTIRRAGDMTPRGRRAIAAWLRDHARWIVQHGKEYSPRFTGRYLYAWLPFCYYVGATLVCKA